MPDAFSTRRGLVLRAVDQYGLPNSPRMTIGTEEANRLEIETLVRTHGIEFGAMTSATPPFKRIAPIGARPDRLGIAGARHPAVLALPVNSLPPTIRRPRVPRRRKSSSPTASPTITPARSTMPDLVIAAALAGAAGDVAKSIAAHLALGAIVSDVGFG